MHYAIEITKSGAFRSMSPLSAREALKRLEAAEARGIAVTCTNADGLRVAKDNLQEASRSGNL